MTIIILVKLIFLGFLIFVHAIFNGAETAITSLPQSYLNKVKGNNAKARRHVTFWQEHSDNIIATLVIGMNLSVVGVGVFASSISSDISELNPNFLDDKINILLPALAIILTLIFGNIFPKTIARYNPQKVGIALLPVVIRFSKIFRPVVSLLSRISSRIARIFSRSKESPLVKADEIDFLLSNEITSPLPEGSRELVSNIMDFAERRVSQVMVVRPEIFAVNIEDDKATIIKNIIETEFSRVPVYKGNLNNIVGVIYSKDLALTWRNSDIIVIEDLIRPVYYVPDNAKVTQILKEFKEGNHHLAIVVDEFGSTVGSVSLEDLLEEIVGEVWDEYDLVEKNIVDYEKNAYLIQAHESVLNINEALDIEIPDGDYSTINGWMLSLFGKIPKTGEKIIWQNYEAEIQDADEKKINRIILRCIIK